MTTKSYPENQAGPHASPRWEKDGQRPRNPDSPQPKQEFKKYQIIPGIFTKQQVTTEKAS